MNKQRFFTFLYLSIRNLLNPAPKANIDSEKECSFSITWYILYSKMENLSNPSSAIRTYRGRRPLIAAHTDAILKLRAHNVSYDSIAEWLRQSHRVIVKESSLRSHVCKLLQGRP